MPAPRARIDVEELELSVARVALELDLDDAREPKRREDASRATLDLGIVDRLDECAGAAEIHRPLPRAARDDRCDRLAVATQRRVGELLRADTGDELLDHDQ